MAQAAATVIGESADYISKTYMPFEIDAGVGYRAAIGLIVLATDHTVEHEFRKMLNIDGVGFYESRILNDSTINAETLAAMEQRMSEAAAVILPEVPLDVVAYGCTSGAMIIGEETVFARIRESRPGVPCTTPITGAIAAFEALGVKRIALLTPYIEEINQTMRDFIQARGVEVPVMGSFNHDNDNEVARITLESVRAAALELGREPSVDAVFVSCTNVRLVEIVDELEAELGKPVTSSNHAMAWHALRLAGYSDPVPGFGRLMML